MALNLHQKNQMFGALRKRNISYKSMNECICWNEKNEEKEIYEDILGQEILARKREKREILKTFFTDLHL